AMTENATIALTQIIPILMIGFALGRNRAKEHFRGAMLLTFFITIYAAALVEATLIGYLVGPGFAPRWMGLISLACCTPMLGYLAFFGFANMGGGEIQRRMNKHHQ